MELKEIRRNYTVKPSTGHSETTGDLSLLSRFQSLSLFDQNRPAHRPAAPDGLGNNAAQQHGLDMTGYRRIRSVGQGSFGVAILYERHSDGQQVVMKQIALSNLAKPEREMAMNEVEVFSKLHHPNIISYLGSSVRGDLLLIEMEYADGGTLAQMLSERSQGESLPERFVLNMFEQLTSAISYMHSQNILHRDLKTANVFLHGKGTVKVGDFGISKIMHTNVHAQTVLGTPYYFSPEMCEGKEYNEKSDVWALGCIVGEMCCLKKAFTASNLSELVAKIMTAEYVPLPRGYSESLRHVLGLMFQIDPTARPSASELLQYWIPLIYRKLGSMEGFHIDSNANDRPELVGVNIRSKKSGLEDDTTAINYGEGSTALVNTGRNQNTPTCRTVLYQLHSFGMSTSLAPLHLPPTVKIKQIATRGQHFVAVMEDGTVFSWGEGDKGQLGHDALETWHHIPMRVEALKQRKVISTTVGDGFTLFCTASGTVLACGDNSHGCLGQGNKASLLVPKPIAKLEHTPIVQVSSGTTHVLARAESGIVYSWGTSNSGALALGKRINSALEPERVILPQLVQNVREVYAGPDCTILITSQGDCYCCGSNAGNRLGLGRKVPGTATLRKIHLDAGRPKIVGVSVSDTHAAFLIEGGYLVTLGDNSSGQRGVGHRCELLQPTIVPHLQSRYVANVKCSQTYTVATTDDNCVVLWGTRMGTPEGNEDSSGSHGRNNHAEIMLNKTLIKIWTFSGTKSAEPPCCLLSSTMEIGNQRPSLTTVANSTTALANILSSIYKHETILEPADVLA